MEPVNKIINIITERYKSIIIIILVLSLPFTYFFIHQKHFNDIEIYFDEDDPDLKAYKDFQKKYGNEEQLIIVLKDETIFTKKNIDLIKKISNAMFKIKGVHEVFSLTETDEAVGYKDSVTFRKIVPDKKLDESELAYIKTKTMGNRSLVNTLISKDATTTAIVIEIDHFVDTGKRDIVMKIINKAQEIAGGVKLYYVGTPYFESESSRLTKKDNDELTALIIIIIFIIIALLVKNTFLSIIALLNLFVILIWSIGIFVMCGETFNYVTIIISMILLAIAVADSIHLLSKYRDELAINGNNHYLAVKNGLNHVFIPCLFTSLTTAVGFIAFTSSALEPVADVGIYTATGVIIAFLLTMTFLPSALILFQKKIKIKKTDLHNKDDFLSRSLKSTGFFVTNNYKILSVLSILIIAVMIMEISNIKFETNDKNILPDDNELRKGIDFVETNLGGTLPFNFLIKANSESNNFQNPKSLRILDEIQSTITEDPLLTSSFSIVDYFKKINRAFNKGDESQYTIPENSNDIKDFYEIGDEEIFTRIISPDYMEARISFQCIWGSNEAARELLDRNKEYLKLKLEDNFTYQITGLSSLYLKMEEYLKESQIRSFSIAFIIVFLMMIIVCRRFYLPLLCMIPNLFPISATLGVMGAFGIPLDIFTIMIASITIGIAVDDTIHFIVRLKNNCSSQTGLKEAIIKSYGDVGKQIVITSIVLIISFFSLIFANTMPTKIFGILTGLSIFFALVGDLIILPALILLLKPRL